MLTRLLCSLSLVMCVATGVWGADDPVVGTWKLDVAASMYSPGPAPASEIRVYEKQPDGSIKATIHTTEANGHTSVIEVAANYDNKEYPVSGDFRATATSLKRITPYKSEAKLLHGKTVVATILREISEDGKRMTITYMGADSDQGKQINNTAVYNKQ